VVKSCNILGDKIHALNWTVDDSVGVPLKSINVIIAVYTTTHGWFELYCYLDLLSDRVLYYDTDSIIYIFTRTALQN